MRTNVCSKIVDANFCDCGARKAGTPAHAFWCASEKAQVEKAPAIEGDGWKAFPANPPDFSDITDIDIDRLFKDVRPVDIIDATWRQMSSDADILMSIYL